jgi:hypothetical protein
VFSLLPAAPQRHRSSRPSRGGCAATDLANRWWASRREIGRAERLIDRQSLSYRAGDHPPDWACRLDFANPEYR